MKSIRLFSLLLLIVSLSPFVGCVSVNIGPKGPNKSKGVEFSEPSAPFERLAETRADGAWQNRKNGSSISYFSSCHDPADPTIEVATRELFYGLTDMKTIKSEPSRFNGRESLDMEVEGQVEGITTRIRSVVFKKNGCLYTISHIAVPKAFEQDRSRFRDFLASFVAP